jgi:hypothetical protein
MSIPDICRICGKPLYAKDHPIFVKVKGQRKLRWYCRECVKGGGKHDTDRKGQ